MQREGGEALSGRAPRQREMKVWTSVGDERVVLESE